MKMKKGKEKQRMRRLSALLLSLMLICALSMTAFATDGGSESGDGSGSVQKVEFSQHSYKAYQIFKGVYSEDLGKLSNIEWGDDANDGVKSVIAETLKVDADLEKILTALEGVSKDPDVSKANDLAAAIASKLDMSKGTLVDSNTDNLPHGYYIVIDITDNDAIKDGESRNFALLQCTNGSIEIKKKTGTVSSDKKVIDTNDSTPNPNGESADTSADYDINDRVPFVLTGKVAKNYDMYQTYKFVFHDTASAGLTFDDESKGSIEVTLDGTKTIDSSNYRVETEKITEDGEEKTKIQIIFEDLKGISDVRPNSEIKISYTLKLNDQAVIGGAGNPNTMHLEYSNNPSGNGTGETPKQTVVVFTYEVVVNKVNENSEPLVGAEFALYKADPSYTGNDNPLEDDNYKKYNKSAGIYTVEAGTKFSFKGIDDGEYLLVETKTPEGYNSIEPVEFKVTANHSDGGVILSAENADTKDGAVKLTAAEGSGTLGADVVNKSGSLLPSTGGIGTTMFYIIGGILMVGACMMLFVRKIMTNEKR